jgi:hypothetical protein
MEKKSTRQGIGRTPASEPPLPAERAFVVQLRAQSGPADDLFLGRAEHMATGTAERFASAEELISFIEKVLAAQRRGGSRGSRRHSR